MIRFILVHTTLLVLAASWVVGGSVLGVWLALAVRGTDRRNKELAKGGDTAPPRSGQHPDRLQTSEDQTPTSTAESAGITLHHEQ
jgi:hypothetical protein